MGFRKIPVRSVHTSIKGMSNVVDTVLEGSLASCHMKC